MNVQRLQDGSQAGIRHQHRGADLLQVIWSIQRSEYRSGRGRLLRHNPSGEVGELSDTGGDTAEEVGVDKEYGVVFSRLAKKSALPY